MSFCPSQDCFSFLLHCKGTTKTENEKTKREEMCEIATFVDICQRGNTFLAQIGTYLLNFLLLQCRSLLVPRRRNCPRPRR